MFQQLLYKLKITLLPQLKSDFTRTITWNKYLAKPALLAQNANLNCKFKFN